MRIPVNSPWLPGYINVMQAILVTLTTVGLFLDRPHVSENLDPSLNLGIELIYT